MEPDLGDLYELEIDPQNDTIIARGFWLDKALMNPEVTRWCHDNLEGGCVVEVRWHHGDDGRPGCRFVAVLSTREDASLFRLYWL